MHFVAADVLARSLFFLSGGSREKIFLFLVFGAERAKHEIFVQEVLRVREVSWEHGTNDVREGESDGVRREDAE